MSSCVLMNMCMIYDEVTGRVLVQDKINSKWSGITFPGGHVDDGESIYESTIREVKEETGLTVTNLKQTGLIHFFNREKQERRMIFFYKTSHFEGSLIDESNEGKVFWVSIEELKDMELAPGMRDFIKIFMDDDIIEAFITPDNNYTFLPAK